MIIKSSKSKPKQRFPNVLLNEFYKGSPNENAQKSTSKPGMQYLGRVNKTNKLPPPVWLPSRKATLCGQDPDINLVPAGTSGWGAASKTAPSSNPSSSKTEQDEVEKPVDTSPNENCYTEKHVPMTTTKTVPLKPFFAQSQESQESTEEVKPAQEKPPEAPSNPKGASEIVGKISGWAAVNEEPDFDEQLVFSGDEDNSIDRQFSSEEECEVESPRRPVEPVQTESQASETTDHHSSVPVTELSYHHHHHVQQPQQHHNLSQPPPLSQQQHMQAPFHLLHQQPEIFDNAGYDPTTGSMQEYGLIKKREERTQDFNNAIEKAHKNRRKPNPGIYTPATDNHQMQQPKNDNLQQYHQQQSQFDYSNRYNMQSRPNYMVKKNEENIWSGSQMNSNDLANRFENINILKHEPSNNDQGKNHETYPYANNQQKSPHLSSQHIQPEIKILAKPPNNNTNVFKHTHQSQVDTNNGTFDRNPSLTNISNVSSLEKMSNPPSVSTAATTAPPKKLPTTIQPLMEINAQPASEHLNFLWEDKIDVKSSRPLASNPTTYTSRGGASRGAVSRGAIKSYNYNSNSTNKRNYTPSDQTSKEPTPTSQTSNGKPSISGNRYQSRNDPRPPRRDAKENSTQRDDQITKWNNPEETTSNSNNAETDETLQESSNQHQHMNPRYKGNNYKGFQRKTKSQYPGEEDRKPSTRGGGNVGRRGPYRGSRGGKTAYHNDSHEYYRMNQNQTKNYNNHDDKSDGGNGPGTMGSTNQNSSANATSQQNGGNQQQTKNSSTKQNNIQSTGSNNNRDNNSDVDEWETATEGSVSDRINNGQTFERPEDGGRSDDEDTSNRNHDNNTTAANNNGYYNHANRGHRNNQFKSNYRGNNPHREYNNGNSGYSKRTFHANNNNNKFSTAPTKFVQKESGFRHSRQHQGYSNNTEDLANQNFQKRDGRKPWKINKHEEARRKDEEKPSDEPPGESSDAKEKNKKPEVTHEPTQEELDDAKIFEMYNSFETDCDTSSEASFVEVVPKSTKRKQKKLNEKKKGLKTNTNTAKNKPSPTKNTNKMANNKGNSKSQSSNSTPAKASESKKIELNVSKEIDKKTAIAQVQPKRVLLKPTTDAWKKPSLTVKAILGEKVPVKKEKSDPQPSTGENKSEDPNSASWSKAVGSRLNKNYEKDHKRSRTSNKHYELTNKESNDSHKIEITIQPQTKPSQNTVGEEQDRIKSLWNQQTTESQIIKSNEKRTDIFPSSDDEDTMTKSSNSSKTHSIMKDNSLSIVSTSNNVCKVKPQQHASQLQPQQQTLPDAALDAISSVSANEVKLLQGSRNFANDSKLPNWKAENMANYNAESSIFSGKTGQSAQIMYPQQQDVSNLAKLAGRFSFNDLSLSLSTQGQQPQQPVDLYPQSPVSNGQGRQLFQQPSYPHDLMRYNDSIFQNANMQQLRGLYPHQTSGTPANLMATTAHPYQGRSSQQQHQGNSYEPHGKWNPGMYNSGGGRASANHHSQLYRSQQTQQQQHQPRSEDILLLNSQNGYNTPGLADKLTGHNVSAAAVSSSNHNLGLMKSLSNSGTNLSILPHQQMYSHHPHYQKDPHHLGTPSDHHQHSNFGGHHPALFHATGNNSSPGNGSHNTRHPRSTPSSNQAPPPPVNVNQPPPPFHHHAPLALAAAAAMGHPHALYPANDSSEDLSLTRSHHGRYAAGASASGGGSSIFHQPPLHLPIPSPNNPHHHNPYQQQGPYHHHHTSNNGPWKFPHTTIQ